MKNFKISIVVQIALGLMGALPLAGCGGGGTSVSILPTGQTFTQSAGAFNNQLDILWVVDNSGSMSPLQTNLNNNFSSFINNFKTKGYDFKMAVTATDAYLADPTLNGYIAGNSSLAKFRDGTTSHTGVFVIIPTTPNLNNTFITNATTGSSSSGDERAFSSIRTAMNSNQNAGFLRASSFFAVVILSDEDDFSGNSRCEGCGTDHNYNAGTLDTVATYENYIDTLTQTTGATRRWNASAITVPDSACQTSHGSGSIIGTRYMQMVADTNGVLGSVCDASFATSLNNIQSKIAELSTQFFLNKIPQVNTIVVTVNGSMDPQDANNGWTYNSAANSVVFHGSYIPAQGASINVAFVPATIQH